MNHVGSFLIHRIIGIHEIMGTHYTLYSSSCGPGLMRSCMNHYSGNHGLMMNRIRGLMGIGRIMNQYRIMAYLCGNNGFIHD